MLGMKVALAARNVLHFYERCQEGAYDFLAELIDPGEQAGLSEKDQK